MLFRSNDALEKWTASLDYNYKTEKNKERFMKDKAKYIELHLDRERWSNRLDVDLFKQFVDFYDESISSN